MASPKLNLDLVSAVCQASVPGCPEAVSFEPLDGGMINEVVGVRFASEPFDAVLKVSKETGDPFQAEHRNLDFLNESKLLRVPRALGRKPSDATLPPALVLERIPGVHLGLATLNPVDVARIERQMAEELLGLHRVTSDRFGLYGENSLAEWIEFFEPMIEDAHSRCRGRLPDGWSERIDSLVARLPEAFAIGPKPIPTLIHGDIWHGNVMVAKDDEGWRLVGFLDPGLLFADIEYELAYVQVFDSLGSAFFDCYLAERPFREGYRLRRFYYWLNSMIMHYVLFGHRYLERVEHVLNELEAEWPKWE